jgi:hypothetical protein
MPVDALSSHQSGLNDRKHSLGLRLEHGFAFADAERATDDWIAGPVALLDEIAARCPVLPGLNRSGFAGGFNS